jgi:hypothetical protein
MAHLALRKLAQQRQPGFGRALHHRTKVPFQAPEPARTRIERGEREDKNSARDDEFQRAISR